MVFFLYKYFLFSYLCLKRNRKGLTFILYSLEKTTVPSSKMIMWLNTRCVTFERIYWHEMENTYVCF